MRQLPGGGAGPAWNADMIRQLGFIKKQLRYPVSRYTVLPVALMSLTIPTAALLVYFMITVRNNSHNKALPPLIGTCFVAVAAVISARRFWQTLHFKAVPTSYPASVNQLLLQRFLQSRHFAFSRHPEAPEVFQIMSRNLNAVKEEREIVVFIADEGRILINSHFTQNRSVFASGTPHREQLATMLQQWLAARGTDPGTGLMPSF